MTPRRHGPLSVGAVVLVFCACFLTAGFAAGASEGVAAVPVGGWACAQAGAARHDRTAATANDRTMRKLRERWESPMARRRQDGLLRESKTRACPRRPQVSSSAGSASLPPIGFHHESRHRINFLLLKEKVFALIPAPGLVVFAHAPQPDFIRHTLPRKGEQPLAKPFALIVRGDE